MTVGLEEWLSRPSLARAAGMTEPGLSAGSHFIPKLSPLPVPGEGTLMAPQASKQLREASKGFRRQDLGPQTGIDAGGADGVGGHQRLQRIAERLAPL